MNLKIGTDASVSSSGLQPPRNSNNSRSPPGSTPARPRSKRANPHLLRALPDLHGAVLLENASRLGLASARRRDEDAEMVHGIRGIINHACPRAWQASVDK